MLLRVGRAEESLRLLDDVAPLTIAKHGKNSAIYVTLQMIRSDALVALGRDHETRQARAEAAAAQPVK